MFEWDVNSACESHWCLHAVASHEICQSFTGYTEDGGY
jgi:hypothetical protein